MRTLADLVEYPFPWPDESKGYELFPTAVAQDPHVYYHAKPSHMVPSILEHGLKPSFEKGLLGVSFANTSAYALAHACSSRTENQAWTVFAARFSTPPRSVRGSGPDGLGMAVVEPDVHVYDLSMLPHLFAYCEIPGSYRHR